MATYSATNPLNGKTSTGYLYNLTSHAWQAISTIPKADLAAYYASSAPPAPAPATSPVTAALAVLKVAAPSAPSSIATAAASSPASTGPTTRRVIISYTRVPQLSGGSIDQPNFRTVALLPYVGRSPATGEWLPDVSRYPAPPPGYPYPTDPTIKLDSELGTAKPATRYGGLDAGGGTYRWDHLAWRKRLVWNEGPDPGNDVNAWGLLSPVEQSFRQADIGHQDKDYSTVQTIAKVTMIAAVGTGLAVGAAAAFAPAAAAAPGAAAPSTAGAAAAVPEIATTAPSLASLAGSGSMVGGFGAGIGGGAAVIPESLVGIVGSGAAAAGAAALPAVATAAPAGAGASTGAGLLGAGGAAGALPILKKAAPLLAPLLGGGGSSSSTSSPASPAAPAAAESGPGELAGELDRILAFLMPPLGALP